jgi:MFS superfamily sulfate permease-like transporter
MNTANMSNATKATFARDLLASVVVFLVALPLCMGIAIASGAPPAAGLVTGIIGGLVAGGLAGCPLQVSGPAAGLAVIVYEIIQKHGFESLAPILLIAGLLQLAAGALKVGQMFRAIAPAVVYGMLAGIGILIFAAQFHVMVDDKPRSNGLLNLISIPQSIQKGIFPIDGSSHHIAAALGLTTILVLIGWTKFAPRKLKWVPGALVAVAVATIAAQMLAMPVKYVSIPDNLLGSIRLPAWNSVLSMLSPELFLMALTIAFVASAETLLSATAVDQMHDGPRANYDKELLAQGAGNMIAGALGGLPMTGVIVRSATNVAAGARTRASAMMHGVWLLVMVAAMPFVLRAVPTASLAAVLVYTGYKLVNVQNIRRLMQYGAFPVAIYAATVIMIVATDLLTGILVGIGLSVVKILYGLTHMSIRVSRDPLHNRIDVHVIGAATFIRMPKLVDTLDALPAGVEVHVHLGAVTYVDHACMEALANWERQHTGRDSKVVVEWAELRAKYEAYHGWGGAPLTHLKPSVADAASH